MVDQSTKEPSMYLQIGKHKQTGEVAVIDMASPAFNPRLWEYVGNLHMEPIGAISTIGLQLIEKQALAASIAPDRKAHGPLSVPVFVFLAGLKEESASPPRG
jgi:hypothetical protein